jgi:DNA-binding HxlR family transcriptional regulator
MGRRSYGQFCGLARALDVVGDRWSLLVVRELLVGPARYGELREALTGVATNLLAERLRALEASGVIERRLDRRNRCTVYALTEWGEGLRDPIEGLIRWSTPLVAAGRGDDTFQGAWLVVALQALAGRRTAARPLAVGVEAADAQLTVRLDETGVSVTLGFDPRPATVLKAEPQVVLGLASGALTVPEAIASGTLEGDPRKLEAVFANLTPPADPVTAG